MPLSLEPPAVLLLAAGYSQRFGSDKTLHPLADGTPMALATARRIQSVLAPLWVIVRPEQLRLQSLLHADDIRYLLNDAAEQGISASLRCGVHATAQASGWLIALADMPQIQPSTYLTLYQMLSNHHPHLLCAPDYQGKRGHPVGFGAGWRDALLSCQADQGARAILHQHAMSVAMIECHDPGVICDIDIKPSALLREYRSSLIDDL